MPQGLSVFPNRVDKDVALNAGRQERNSCRKVHEGTSLLLTASYRKFHVIRVYKRNKQMPRIPSSQYIIT